MANGRAASRESIIVGCMVTATLSTILLVWLAGYLWLS